MFHGTSRGGVKNPIEARPNLGGPSKTTRQDENDLCRHAKCWDSFAARDIVRLVLPCKMMGQLCSPGYCLMKDKNVMLV